MTPLLYNKTNIQNFRWPQTPHGQYAKNYLLPLMTQGVSSYVQNIETELQLLTLDDLILPVTINQHEYENSYVASPYTHYITYAQQELYLIKNPFLRSLLYHSLKQIGWLSQKTNFNRVICPNNWLVSTNLHPEITTKQITCITEKLSSKFPNHAILWRSVSEAQPELLNSFLQSGYLPVISRQIYWFDHQIMPKNKDVKNDLTLARKTPYELVTPDNIKISDAPRIQELYQMLYLDKYFKTNPQYTISFFENAIRHQLFQFFGYRKDNQLEAILGYFIQNKTMTTPIFGYNTQTQKKDGLYRLISLTLIQEALKHGYKLHSSSGASEFKKHRGAEPFIEYSLVHTAHLPRPQRLFWQALSTLSLKIGKPLLEKYQL